MIQPDNLERVRLVEDRGCKIGSVTTSDVLTTDSDTLFPLQAALGYDIAQHLFIAKENLVVEGPSDFLPSRRSRSVAGGKSPTLAVVPTVSLDAEDKTLPRCLL